MAKAKKRKPQQECDLVKVIGTIEKAASMATQLYRAIEPMISAILTKGRRTK